SEGLNKRSCSYTRIRKVHLVPLGVQRVPCEAVEYSSSKQGPFQLADSPSLDSGPPSWRGGDNHVVVLRASSLCYWRRNQVAEPAKSFFSFEQSESSRNASKKDECKAGHLNNTVARTISNWPHQWYADDDESCSPQRNCSGPCKCEAQQEICYQMTQHPAAGDHCNLPV